MGTMVETIQSAIIPEQELETGVQPETTRPDDGAIETQLTQEISVLWSNHTLLSANHKTTARELRQIRARLAEKLATIKTLLSRPGRGGEWRGWLRERGIPRSTADRLVSRYSETLGTANNVPTGAIPEPAKPTPEKLAETVWPSLKRVLTSGESVVDFTGCIAKISGVPYEEREIGLMIFYPVPKVADELSSSASAPDPTSQHSDEASAITEEPKDETAATPTEVGLVVGAPETSNLVAT
jgi:hypothetical protein